MNFHIQVTYNHLQYVYVVW